MIDGEKYDPEMNIVAEDRAIESQKLEVHRQEMQVSGMANQVPSMQIRDWIIGFFFSYRYAIQPPSSTEVKPRVDNDEALMSEYCTANLGKTF